MPAPIISAIGMGLRALAMSGLRGAAMAGRATAAAGSFVGRAGMRGAAAVSRATASVTVNPLRQTLVGLQRNLPRSIQTTRQAFRQLATRTNQATDSLLHARRGLEAWTRELSDATDNLRFYSSKVSEAQSLLERGRVQREFVRGRNVGTTAAAAINTQNRLEERVIAPMSRILENIYNLLKGGIFELILRVADLLYIPEILRWLERMFPSAPVGQPLPWMGAWTRLSGIQF